MQTPEAPPLEQWDPGVPDRVVPATDPAWTWTGAWTDETRGANAQVVGKRSETPGATAEVTFTGTGVALVGPHGRDGGRAEVFLDGRNVATIDAWIPDRTSDNDLWHAEGLPAGAHTLRIVVGGESDPRASGHRIGIHRVIAYRAR
jgi:hypothetical protein